MNKNKRLAMPALCLIQAGVLFLGNVSVLPAAYASSHSSSKSSRSSKKSSSASQSAELDKFEQQIFGVTHSDLSTKERLDRLEKIIFGSTKSGSTDKRLRELADAMGPNGSNQLLPKMAPQMDTASGSGNHDIAPQRDDGSYDDTASSGTSAAEKEQLKAAMELYSQGKTDEAASAFQRIINSDDRCVDAYFNLGVLEEGRGNLSEALRNYKAAADLKPSDSEISQAVTAVEKKLGHEQGGQDQASKLAHLKGLVADAAVAYKGGNYDKAISDLSTVANEEPTDPDVQYALSQAYKAKGQLFQARNSLQAALAIDPSNPLYKKAMDDLNERRAQMSNGGGSTSSRPGQLTGFAGGTGSSEPAGQLTPFTGGAGDSAQNSLNGSVFGGSSGGSLLGGLLGLGGIGALGGMSTYRSNVKGLSSSRMKRAAIDSLAGAAVGALYAKTTHGSVKQGAMRGALMGGLIGVFSGY